VFQLQLARRINAVPITRDYMTDWERHGHVPAWRDISGAVTLNR
jgi:hypothetical protein